MIKTLLLLLALFAINMFSYGQRYYKTALGAQAGEVSGVRLKHYIAEEFSIQGIAGWSPKNSYSIQTHIQWNCDGAFNNTNGYVGLGGFAGAYDNRSEDNPDRKSGFWLGPSLNVGLEYTFPKIPISCHVAATIGYSFSPAKDITGGYNGGISYAFK